MQCLRLQCAAFRPFQDARCMALLPNALQQLEVFYVQFCSFVETPVVHAPHCISTDSSHPFTKSVFAV